MFRRTGSILKEPKMMSLLKFDSRTVIHGWY